MRQKILAFQFRKNEHSLEQEQKAIEREVGVSAEVNFINALDTSISWIDPEVLLDGYQGVLLGGSGDFYFDGNCDTEDPNRKISYEFLERLRPLFVHLFMYDIPTLGICYGHQLLGAFAGAQVRYDDKQKKTRSHKLTVLVDTHDYFLFSDLPETFQAHYGHKDSLDRVPEGAVLLMSGGEQCQISALRYKNNIYTTQFHPELNFADMVDRINTSLGYLPEGVMASEIFSDDPNSNKILQNFGKFVALRQEQSMTKMK